MTIKANEMTSLNVSLLPMISFFMFLNNRIICKVISRIREAIKRTLNIKSNLNVSVETISVLVRDFASIIRSARPISPNTGIAYLNYLTPVISKIVNDSIFHISSSIFSCIGFGRPPLSNLTLKTMLT